MHLQTPLLPLLYHLHRFFIVDQEIIAKATISMHRVKVTAVALVAPLLVIINHPQSGNLLPLTKRQQKEALQVVIVMHSKAGAKPKWNPIHSFQDVYPISFHNQFCFF